MTKQDFDRVRTTADGSFEYGHISTSEQINGSMVPFRPHWWAQHMGDGTEDIFDSYLECLAWIRSWRE